MGGGNGQFRGYNPICIAGPQMNKKIMRKLQHAGALTRSRGHTCITTAPSTRTPGSRRWTSWGSTRCW